MGRRLKVINNLQTGRIVRFYVTLFSRIFDQRTHRTDETRGSERATSESSNTQNFILLNHQIAESLVFRIVKFLELLLVENRN